MSKPHRRILFAFIAAIVFMVLAINIGWTADVVEPISLMFLDIFPNYGHDPRTALIYILSPILCYAIVFWTIGTIWNMLAKLYRRGR